MNIKNKKSMEGGTWWIIIGAIVAIMVAAIILYIVRGGLISGKESVDFLGDCKGQNGHCEPCDTATGCKSPCTSTESGFFQFRGCNENEYCCIPKPT